MAAITTTAKVTKALEQNAQTVSDTTLIDRLIGEVGEDFGNYCNRDFLYAARLEVFDGQGTTAYGLKNFPAIGVTKLESFSVKSSGVETWITEDQDTYRVDLTNGVIYYPSGFTAGFQNWRVTYTSGYDAGSNPVKTVPQDLEGAAIAEVCRRWIAYQTEPIPVPSGSRLEDVRAVILSDVAKAILDNYRIPGLR